ncbi:MAG: type I-E CRISPR-associated protein Cas5/CasD [Clostridiales Family XIII bacterium]|jgi:CRISPR system Cascade subunit CasD|nr:type I-E CRISPR-associated protein Cas5/CasD [Clostridiales Family XIII bacterium]
MSTLLLRLAAPLQAWGTDSKFNRRTTNREPTKSGVIGLSAAALGCGRDDSVEELSELRFAVRIDQAGKLMKDFHTAHTFGKKKQAAFISDRYYLADAVFLAGLEGPRDLLEKIEAALQNPVFPLSLGRRSCPPTEPLVLGIVEKPLLDALREAPWHASDWYKTGQPENVHLEIVRDADFGEPGSFERRDLPLSFSQRHRQYAFRSVFSDMRAVSVENELAARARTGEASADDRMRTEHDPFGGLEVEDVSIQG